MIKSDLRHFNRFSDSEMLPSSRGLIIRRCKEIETVVETVEVKSLKLATSR